MGLKGIKQLKANNLVSLLVVAVASLMLEVTYFVFIGLSAAAIVLWSEQLGLRPFDLIGGVGLFAALMALELTLVLVFNKPAPFILLFFVPIAIGYIAVKQAYSSEMIREALRAVETRIRTPPFIRLE